MCSNLLSKFVLVYVDHEGVTALLATSFDEVDAMVNFYNQLYEFHTPPISSDYFKRLIGNKSVADPLSPTEALETLTEIDIKLFAKICDVSKIDIGFFVLPIK